MRKKRLLYQGIKGEILSIIILTIFLLMGVTAGKADAAGLLIADGGFGGVLEIKEHDVHVTINNGIAVTNVTQVFHNTENRQVEALYTFPVPKGASVSNFSMWINGKEMVGEVLEKKRAREIYNSYKRRRKDPGLLEQVDYKSFEMRIYPINANADQKVQITYYQEIGIDHDRATYVYPLATVTRRGVDSRTTGKFSINMEVKSAVPIAEIESPSHERDFVMAKHSEDYAVASLESKAGSLASDVVVSYTLSRPKTGIDLITSRKAGEDGYFLLTVTAGDELEKLDDGMDYVFVLDISGSMANEGKLSVSRNSVDAFIDELGESDRFEVMTFNVTPTTLFGELRPGTEDMKTQARDFMSSQQARGGTNLAPAMSTAYKYGDPDRSLNVVVLSDGMTDQGERQVLMTQIQSRPSNSRVFCIGIGNEVNRQLLEQMAEDSGGLAAFISRGDNFKARAKGFRRKLMRPAATDLRIDYGRVRVSDVEPVVLPNLYHGSPIRIYGRYSGPDEGVITLTGNVLGREIEQTATLMFPKEDPGNPEIERMWAWKRIDQLLKKADRSGSRNQVIDEIVRLGEEYSIASEYTSFLVLENDNEYRRWKIERRNNLRLRRDRRAQDTRMKLLEKIRNKAISDIGPQTTEKEQVVLNRQAPKRVQPVPSVPNTATPQNQPREPRRQSWDFSFGSGPVGPGFVAVSYWLKRRRKKK